MLGFVSILSFDTLKGDKENNCARFFRVFKYTFLLFEKRNKQKIASGFLAIGSILLFDI